MQEALKNPHYKKIWEKVIINRHPEAKSLEDALLIESEIKGCLALVMDYFGNTFLEEIFYCTDSDYVVVYKGAEPMGSGLGDFCHVSFYRKNLCNIIGRPITLEDILILFGKTFSQTLNGFKFVQLTCEGAFITMQPIEHTLHRIEVILGKPLHEQTPETWEKIANLID